MNMDGVHGLLGIRISTNPWLQKGKINGFFGHGTAVILLFHVKSTPHRLAQHIRTHSTDVREMHRITMTITYPMIRFQIVNLLLEYDGPQILAEELDHVQLIRKPRSVTREPFAQSLANTES